MKNFFGMYIVFRYLLKKKSGANSRYNKNVDPIDGKLFITSLLKCDPLGEANAFIEVVSYSNLLEGFL